MQIVFQYLDGNQENKDQILNQNTLKIIPLEAMTFKLSRHTPEDESTHNC